MIAPSYSYPPNGENALQEQAWQKADRDTSHRTGETSNSIGHRVTETVGRYPIAALAAAAAIGITAGWLVKRKL